MSHYVDFAELKETVRIEQVAEMLNLTFEVRHGQLRGPCSACQGDDRSLVITPGKQAYYCFKARKGGDLIALAAHILHVGQKEAAERIAEHFRIGNSTSTRNSTRPGNSSPARPEQKEAGLKPLDYLEADHEAVAAVGFDVDTANAIGIGYAPRGTMSGLVAVPVRLPDGTLTGYIGITEAKLPRQFHLSSNVVPLRQRA